MPPPYRADHVGSLLRPAKVEEARKRHFEDKVIDGEELRAIEDEAILDIVRMQRNAGLLAVTDGEIRRSFWHYDFLGALTGFELVERDEGIPFHGGTLRPVFPRIIGKLDFPEDHPMLEHYKYLSSVTDLTPKISIPGPSCCHFLTAREDIHPREYRDDPEALFADLSRTYAKAVKAFYEAGCRYLQMDDIYFAYLCDPKIRTRKASEGTDPDWLISRYAPMMHDAIAARPDDMLIAMHMRRGEGAYDLAADAVFNQTDIDIYFMGYDGGLEALRLLPRGKKRVLPGFITTKTGELEKLDDLKRKFEAASKFADLDQLGIAPQCGFALTEEGSRISEDGQKRKLDLVVQTAEAIWGGVDK